MTANLEIVNEYLKMLEIAKLDCELIWLKRKHNRALYTKS